MKSQKKRRSNEHLKHHPLRKGKRVKMDCHSSASLYTSEVKVSTQLQHRNQKEHRCSVNMYQTIPQKTCKALNVKCRLSLPGRSELKQRVDKYGKRAQHQVWQLRPVKPLLKRLRQEDHGSRLPWIYSEFKASLGHIVRPCLKTKS